MRTRTSKPSRTKKAGRETILVPIDFSPHSQQAIRWAKFIAQQSHAKVHLVHVHDFEYAIPAEIALEIVLESDIEKSLQKDLRRIATRYDLPNAGAICHIRSGRAFDQVVRLAEEIDAALIVTSTHGYKGLKHVLIGSTAERIVQHSARPVFVVRLTKSGTGRVPRVKRIVVPVDFSDCSTVGLRHALAFAHAFGATLMLLHVVRLDYRLMADGYAMYAAEEILKAATEAAEEEMRRLVAATDFGDVKFQTATESGSPSERICSFAREGAADVIVTSTHGRTGFRHVLVGSTAEHIVRYADCPVLVVPARLKKIR